MKLVVLGPQRPKPKCGDLRETKKHGKQIRIFVKHGGAYVVNSRGQHYYQWVSYDEAREQGYGHYLSKE